MSHYPKLNQFQAIDNLQVLMKVGILVNLVIVGEPCMNTNLSNLVHNDQCFMNERVKYNVE